MNWKLYSTPLAMQASNYRIIRMQEGKERQEREQTASTAAAREIEIATANPLLNLAAALGQTPNGVNTTVPGSFAVKRRWDDGMEPRSLFLSAMTPHATSSRSHIQKSSHE